jgi:predicted GNAT family N-acyltransferase
MKIVPLSEEHDRLEFDCGESPLNLYLQRYAGQHARKGLVRIYVAVEEDSLVVKGYYSLSSGSVSFDVVPVNLPHHPVPIALIGRLAVDRTMQGKKLGETLLIDALKRVLGAAEHVGIYAVVVDALNERVQSFYCKYGFHELLDDKLHLYLPVKVIRKLPL